MELQRCDGPRRTLPGPGGGPHLEILTATPDEAEGASPGAGGYWSEAFQRLVSTLRLRAAMMSELAGAPGPQAPDERSSPAQAPAPVDTTPTED